MFRLLILGAVIVGTYIAYTATRDYVARRLRYVDAVRKPGAPFLAGAAAAILALPVMAFLPFVGAGTAISLGLAVGMGVSAGTRGTRLKGEVFPE